MSQPVQSPKIVPAHYQHQAYVPPAYVPMPMNAMHVSMLAMQQTPEIQQAFQDQMQTMEANIAKMYYDAINAKIKAKAKASFSASKSLIVEKESLERDRYNRTAKNALLKNNAVLVGGALCDPDDFETGCAYVNDRHKVCGNPGPKHPVEGMTSDHHNHRPFLYCQKHVTLMETEDTQAAQNALANRCIRAYLDSPNVRQVDIDATNAPAPAPAPARAQGHPPLSFFIHDPAVDDEEDASMDWESTADNDDSAYEEEESQPMPNMAKSRSESESESEPEPKVEQVAVVKPEPVKLTINNLNLSPAPRPRGRPPKKTASVSSSEESSLGLSNVVKGLNLSD